MSLGSGRLERHLAEVNYVLILIMTTMRLTTGIIGGVLQLGHTNGGFNGKRGLSKHRKCHSEIHLIVAMDSVIFLLSHTSQAAD